MCLLVCLSLRVYFYINFEIIISLSAPHQPKYTYFKLCAWFSGIEYRGCSNPTLFLRWSLRSQGWKSNWIGCQPGVGRRTWLHQLQRRSAEAMHQSSSVRLQVINTVQNKLNYYVFLSFSTTRAAILQRDRRHPGWEPLYKVPVWTVVIFLVD